MDQCWTPIGHFRLIFLYTYTFYSSYTTVWIANTEIGLEQNDSVIKRLWFTLQTSGRSLSKVNYLHYIQC